MNTQNRHLIVKRENEGIVDFYELEPGIGISFNQINTDSWKKGDGSFFGERMLILNFCLRGRCEASLAQNRYGIVKEGEVCVSTVLPSEDFYYPGRLYEGIQLFLDLGILAQMEGRDVLTGMGIHTERVIEQYCGRDGLYIHRMNNVLSEVVKRAWGDREAPELGDLRYLTVRLLRELMLMPRESEPEMYFSRSQVAIVKEAEALILGDLSRRVTAREMAERFGISESSFKLYVKGILGDSYLNYFRRKRMERAAELLESTTLKVIEIASAVGYENQGKFAKAFAELYCISPIEFRRASRQNIMTPGQIKAPALAKAASRNK